MSDFKVTAKDLVSNTFSPRVAILCSRVAENVCKKNDLTFTQLIQPFCTLTTDLTWQEPSSQSVAARPLRITPVDIALWKPSDQDAVKNRTILNNVVSRTTPPLYGLQEPDNFFTSHKLGSGSSEYKVTVPESTTWFTSWRETFLRLQSEQQNNQHEFLHHFMACILVISSSEVKSSEDLSSIVGKLSKLQQQHQIEWPHTWILPSVIKFYLILHDDSVDDSNPAEVMYQSLRTIYGGNFCYMLKVNSALPDDIENSVPDPWSSFADQEFDSQQGTDEFSSEIIKPYEEIEAITQPELFHPLSPESELSSPILPQNGEIKQKGEFRKRGSCLRHQDLQNIQVAINEFIGKALLPYVERQARLLHESILNRRGMSKSFFSATKRLFGTTAKPATSVVYTPESLEMMSRKLADIYFLFGHYSGAYQFYHQIKKDFSADCAWTHYASSLEMAALSHFMMTQSNPPMAIARSFPVHYINEAIGHYIDHCRMTDAAIRCAVVCCECLRQMENYGEAAAIFIRMTSEDCDLRSALMLEQAAYTFLQMSSPRKYALHSVLAGHRYAKAGLKSHSLNSYLQAGQVYHNRGWRFAEDHVHFTIARHQCSLQIYTGILHHLKSLLITPTPQPPQQIQIFFKEFLTVMSKLYQEDSFPQEFCVPKIVSEGIMVRIAVPDLVTGEINNAPFQLELNSTSLDTLEEQIVKECGINSVIHFKPSRLLFHKGTDNTVHPTVPCNETFYIEFPIENPLSIEISLSSIVLKFDQMTAVSCSMIDNLRMNPGEIKMLRFGVCSSFTGLVTILKLRYYIDYGVLRVPFEQSIVTIGPRLNSTKAEKAGKIYGKDFRNKINVVDQMPLLQVEVEDLPKSLFHAQNTSFMLHLKDRTIDSDQRKRITRVVVACENMQDFLEVHSNADCANDFQVERIRKNYCPIKLTFDGSSSARIPCIFRVPQVGDIAYLNILILYQFQSPVIGSNTSLHRVIKISIKVPLVPCLRLEYSNLKLIDAVTSLALLRVHNVAQTEICVDKLEMKPSDVLLENVICGKEIMTPDDFGSQINILPYESKNIVLRIHDKGDIEDIERTTLLGVKWRASDVAETNSGSLAIVGYYSLNLDDYRLKRDVSFVFQVKHTSKTCNDFNLLPSFIFPVHLLVHPRIAGKMTLSIEKTQYNDLDSGQSLRASTQDVFLIGKTTWMLTTEPNKTINLDFQILVNKPGIYNVAPTVLIKNAETGSHQSFSLHSPVIVSHLPAT